MKHLLPLLALAAITPFAHAADRAPAAAQAKAKAAVPFAKLFAGKLTDAAGKPVDAAALAKAKYVAVYFSAHWCPPCRAFTPKLVEFVKAKQKGDNFAVVFVSSDKNIEAMHEYMSGTGMSWGGTLGRGLDLGPVSEGIQGIPTLRIYDAAGKRVADSYDASGEYIGTAEPLAKLGELLGK